MLGHLIAALHRTLATMVGHPQNSVMHQQQQQQQQQ
jgi:hypothetical protein